jgi:hypothetical protein
MWLALHDKVLDPDSKGTNHDWDGQVIKNINIHRAYWNISKHSFDKPAHQHGRIL